MEPGDLAERLRKGEHVMLVDVRQAWERDICRLPDRLHVPMHELPDRHTEIESDRDGLVVVYCHHGVRSLRAAAFLERVGFDNVASLAGGIDAWSQRIDPDVPRY